MNEKENIESEEINNNKKKQFYIIEKYSYFGLTAGFSIFILSYLGSLLDARLGNKLLFTIIGFVWGIFGSIVYIIFIIKKINRK